MIQALRFEKTLAFFLGLFKTRLLRSIELDLGRCPSLKPVDFEKFGVPTATNLLRAIALGCSNFFLRNASLSGEEKKFARLGAQAMACDEEEKALVGKCEKLFLEVIQSVCNQLFTKKKKPSRLQVGRLVVLETAHSLLLSQKTCTKRDLYYQHKLLFETQKTSDRAVEWASSSLQVNRNELRIVASRRGIVVGDIAWTEGGHRIYVSDTGTIGHLIPASLRLRVSDINTDRLKGVLYIEKETVLFQLAEAKVHETHSVLLVTGKGFADLGTRELLTLLSQNLPIWGLVDADPHGVAVLATLLGSKKRGREGSLISQNVQWLGLHPSAVLPLSERYPNFFLPLTKKDESCIRSLLNRTDLPEKWREELNVMLDFRLKAELEILEAVQNKCLINALESALASISRL